MSAAAVATCSFCGKEVNPRSRLTYTRVTGWHRPGKAGGSDIVLRELLDEWACQWCIDQLRYGVHPAQQRLA
jgi:hypothetical protein